MKNTRTGFVIISHDRAFLRALTRATLWIDRGMVRRQEKGFDAFEAWRDKVWDEEDTQRHKLNRKIKAEARWAVEGISARRKRNQGRVRALQDLRAERAAQINRQGTAAMALDAGPKSGRKVIEAAGHLQELWRQDHPARISHLTVQRGDRIALVGPNGVGKTTLLKMLIGQEEPDTGSVKLGTNLELALFDQARAQLDGDMTLWDSLTGDPDMRVSGKADQVHGARACPNMSSATSRSFCLTKRRRARRCGRCRVAKRRGLLLAKIMARESNLLVLDEPTNDLDVETLDLLQELLGQIRRHGDACQPRP